MLELPPSPLARRKLLHPTSPLTPHLREAAAWSAAESREPLASGHLTWEHLGSAQSPHWFDQCTFRPAAHLRKMENHPGLASACCHHSSHQGGLSSTELEAWEFPELPCGRECLAQAASPVLSREHWRTAWQSCEKLVTQKLLKRGSVLPKNLRHGAWKKAGVHWKTWTCIKTGKSSVLTITMNSLGLLQETPNPQECYHYTAKSSDLHSLGFQKRSPNKKTCICLLG